MNKYGLLGNGISFSKSPELHNIIKDIFNLNLSYELIDTEEDKLLDFLKSDYSGFNVTKPFKEKLLDENIVHSTLVKEIGALNTLYYSDNKIYSDNTDYYGFKYLIESNNIDISNKSIAILGTGGAAKVCYYYLSKYSNNIKYVSRAKKDKITITYEEFDKYSFDIIVNATPIGLNINESPLTKLQVKESIVIELLYNPKRTLLMSYAKKSYNGLVMLIVQALYAQQLWNGSKILINKETISSIIQKLG